MKHTIVNIPVNVLNPQVSPSFLEICMKELPYIVLEVCFFVAVGLLLSVLGLPFLVPIAAHLEFSEKDPLSKKGSNVAYVVLDVIPMWVALFSWITLITNSSVADTEDGPDWKRQSVKLTVVLLLVVCALHVYVMTSAPDYYDLVGYICTAIYIIGQIPVNFFFMKSALKEGMIKSCLMIILEVAFSYVIFLPSVGYRDSDAFPWTTPFILSVLTVVSRHVVTKSPVPSPTAVRLQVCGLFFGQFFSRVAQSKHYGNVNYAIGLEFYMATVSIMCRVSLYQRFAMAKHVADWKCAGMMKAPQSERSREVATFTIVTEIVFDHMCYMMCFVLCFCTLAPAHLSAGEAAGEFICCLVIQICGNIITLLLMVHYEGITVNVRDIAQYVKGELFFWWLMAMASILLFLRGIGNEWDPSIRE